MSDIEIDIEESDKLDEFAKVVNVTTIAQRLKSKRKVYKEEDSDDEDESWIHQLLTYFLTDVIRFGATDNKFANAFMWSYTPLMFIGAFIYSSWFFYNFKEKQYVVVVNPLLSIIIAMSLFSIAIFCKVRNDNWVKKKAERIPSFSNKFWTTISIITLPFVTTLIISVFASVCFLTVFLVNKSGNFTNKLLS